MNDKEALEKLKQIKDAKKEYNKRYREKKILEDTEKEF